jgi:hypothetical protein
MACSYSVAGAISPRPIASLRAQASPEAAAIFFLYPELEHIAETRPWSSELALPQKVNNSCLNIPHASEILGTVFLYTDYAVPVEAIRQELKRVVARSPNWDRKVCGLQVTNTSHRSVGLRALASAADASKAWDLRCEIREKLILFVQQNYPDSLPRISRRDTCSCATRRRTLNRRGPKAPEEQANRQYRPG